jgi:hypothetical protein
MTRNTRLILAALSIVVAVDALLFTGLIPAWGRWYSPDLVYRRQTEALLDGRLALSRSPTDAHFDLVWSQSAVQQAWGLGGPLWRLPFELLAKLSGQPAFPDRVAFAAAIALTTYLLLKAVTLKTAADPTATWQTKTANCLVAVAVVSAFPPFLTLLRVPFNVYEEASAYGCLFAAGLFAGLVTFTHGRRLRTYLVLCFFSGLAAIARPTILAYGVSTFAVAFALSRRAGWTWRQTLGGIASLLLGLACVLGANWLRFGAPWEFGYAFQLNLMYESRFDAPYVDEPIVSAAKELAGAMFFPSDINGLDFFAEDVIRWQSPTPRFRNFYHTTFDLSYLGGMLLCWAFAVRGLLRPAMTCRAPSSLAAIAAAWSFLSVIPLTAFYLRSEVMSSRYVLDFGPAIAAGVAGLFWRLLSIRGSTVRSWSAIVVSLAALSWWAFQVATAQTIAPPGRALTRAEALAAMEWSATFESLPPSYVAEERPRSNGIPTNREGWRSADGRTAPIVLVFFHDPRTIVLEVKPAPGTRMKDNEFRQIKVRIGYEWLELASIESRGARKVLKFSAPKMESNRRGIQMLVLSFADAKEFARPRSRFRMLEIRNEL